MRSHSHSPNPTPPAVGNTAPFDWSGGAAPPNAPPVAGSIEPPTTVLPVGEVGMPPFSSAHQTGTLPPSPNRLSKGRVILAAVLAAGLATAAAVPWLRGNGGREHQSGQAGDTPAALAGPTSLPPAAPETTLPGSTTVTSVELRSPASGAPSTAVTVAGSGEKPSAATSTTVASRPETTAAAPEKRYLAADEVQKLITATKYEGLSGHRFEIAEEFTTDAAKYVVINLDGSQSAVPLNQLKADIAKAEAEAANRPAFSAQVQLGPGVTRTIGFKVGPAKLTRDGIDTRYVIYTDSELDTLTAPVKGFADSSTLSLPYKHLNVSLIKVHGAKATVDGVPANRFYTAVESNQTAMAFELDSRSEQQLDQDHPDMSYISSSSDYLQRKLALVNIGREIYTNSLAYAEECAHAGVPYAQYRAQALQVPLRAYPQANVYYIALSEAQYDSLT